jgi:hypothetical protein
MSIALTDAAEIRFVVDAEVAATITGDRATFDVPQKNGSPDVVYVRVEIQHASGERLFLQPVRYAAARAS